MYAEERRFRTTGLNFLPTKTNVLNFLTGQRLASCSTVGGLEEVRQLEAEYFLDLSKQTQLAASVPQLKEVVLDSHLLDTEEFLPDISHGLLNFIPGSKVGILRTRSGVE